MKLQSSKSRVNNLKDRFFSGKTAKNATTIKQNKPNLKNIKIAISSCKTNKYEILPAGRSEKQTQFKPNTKPIRERLKMNANPFNKMIYKNFMLLVGQKNKPEQTQFQTGRRPPYTPYLHHTSLKIYPKNASIINKLLIYTRFLIDNSIVSFTRYKDCEVYLLFENGEGF